MYIGKYYNKITTSKLLFKVILVTQSNLPITTT